MPPPSRAAALADLGLQALGGGALDTLDAYAVRALAEALGADRTALFEPAADAFVLRAGVGVPRGTRLRRDEAAPILAASEPVPVRLPYGEGLAVRLGAAGEDVGILAALSVDTPDLDADDEAFLSAVAAVLTGAREQARTREALTESTARARAIVETTVDGVITIDEQGVIETFNAAAERIFGYAATEVVGHNVTVLMPEPYHSEHDGYIEAYHRTGRRRIIGTGREVTGRRKDGSTFPMDLAVSEVHLPERTIFTGFVRDISERRTLEQAVLGIAEAERRRIGQDLHDGLGQMLTGTALLARGVARRLGTDGSPVADDAEEVVTHLKEADAYARSLARGLVPVELEEQGLAGLVAALHRLATNAERLFGVESRFEATGVEEEAAGRLPQDAPTHLFRIAQESLSNAVRHGRARRVAFTLAVAPDRVRLRIEDDGRGFPGHVLTGGTDQLAAGPADDPDLPAPLRPDDNRGMGIRIMHYRARILGGTLDIRPGAEGGTVVLCSVPIASAPPTP